MCEVIEMYIIISKDKAIIYMASTLANGLKNSVLKSLGLEVKAKVKIKGKARLRCLRGLHRRAKARARSCRRHRRLVDFRAGGLAHPLPDRAEAPREPGHEQMSNEMQ